MSKTFNFPYQKQCNIWLPLIPIRLNNKVDTQALVDSGATISLFSAEFAELLGLDLEEGIQRFLEGIGGRVLAYEHSVSIAVADRKFTSRICFSPELKTSLNLLGQEGFFNHFEITFNRVKKRLSLKPLP